MYTNLGNSGLKVSRVALGCGLRGQNDPEEFTKLIHKAIDLGINFIDCANVYGLSDNRERAGTSETILGQAIKGKRDDLIITSKVSSPIGTQNGPNDQGTSRYHILREAEKSLKRLNTDHIDIYLIHQFHSSTPYDESLRAMEILIQQGKIRYVGVCNYQAWQVVQSLRMQDTLNAAPLVTIQNPYSLLNRGLEKEMFPMLRETGIGMMAYSPLAAGLLTGTAAQPVVARTKSNQDLNNLIEKTRKPLLKISQETGYTIPQIAIAWILSKPEVSAVITGSDTHQQVEENVASLKAEIPPETLETLDEISKNAEGVFD